MMAAVTEQRDRLARARQAIAALRAAVSDNAEPAPAGPGIRTAFAAVAIAIGLATLLLDQSRDPLPPRLALVALAVLPWLLHRMRLGLPIRSALALIPAAVLFLRGDQLAAMLVILTTTSVVAHGRYPLVIATIAAAVATIAAGGALHRGVSAAAWAGGLALGGVAGWSVRTQRRLVWDLTAARADLERAALVEERRRIARDVHDLIAHSLTVVMLNLTAARLALRRDPAAASATLAETERLGRQALAEVRSLVGLLREDGPAAPEGPPPGAGDLAQLVARLREAGMEVELTALGPLDRVSPAAGLALYRVAQEALSNAARHAAGARVAVRLHVGADEATLTVRDWGRSPAEGARAAEPGGHGLAGMRERATLVGGSLRAGRAEPGWEVSCVVPV